jgi:hypothetical protein
MTAALGRFATRLAEPSADISLSIPATGASGFAGPVVVLFLSLQLPDFI